MYFDGLKTETEIKAHYRRLAFQYHPDRGGDLRTMQAINAAYERALEGANGQTFEAGNGKTYTYRYNAEVERKVMDIIDSLLKLRMPGVEISLIGVWVWVTGETKPHKESLKELKLRWHSGREAWFFAAKPWHGGRSSASLSGLAAKYGCSKFAAEQQERIN